MKYYQRRVVVVDLSIDCQEDIAHNLYQYNGTEYKLISVNQFENTLVYTLEREIEEF